MERKKKSITRENYKKLLAVGLAGTIALGFSGCEKKEAQKQSLFENTLLEKNVIVNSDLGTTIAKCETIGVFAMHEHFTDIVSGIKFSKQEECSCRVKRLENIEIIGSIAEYLTEKELIKASKNELTDEDIIAIVARIQTSNNLENEKKLTK